MMSRDHHSHSDPKLPPSLGPITSSGNLMKINDCKTNNKHLKVKRRKTKKELNNAKFKSHTEIFKKKTFPQGVLPRNNMVGKMVSQSEMKGACNSRQVFITENRLTHHQGIFNHEIKSIDIGRIVNQTNKVDLSKTGTAHPRGRTSQSQGQPCLGLFPTPELKNQDVHSSQKEHSPEIPARISAPTRCNQEDNEPTSYNQQDQERASFNQQDHERASCNQQDHERASCNQQDHERASCSQQDHERASCSQQGNERTSCNQQGHERALCNQQGHERASCNQRGHERASCNQRGHESASCNQRGHEHASCNQQDQERASCNQQDHERASCNQQGSERASCNQQGSEHASCNQQGYERASCNQQDHERASCNQQNHERALCNQQDHEHASCNQQDHEPTSYNQQDQERASCNHQDHERASCNQQGYERASCNQQGYERASCNQQGYERASCNQQGYERASCNQQDHERASCNQQDHERASCNQQDHERASCNQQDHERASCSQQDHERASCSQQDYERASCNQQGHERASGNQRGHERASCNQRGHERASCNQRGHECASCNQRGHERSSCNQQGHERVSCNQQNHERASCKQQDHERASCNQQDHECASGNQQDHEYCLYNQQDRKRTSGIQQDHERASGNQQDHEYSMYNHQDRKRTSGNQKDHQRASGKQQDHQRISGIQQDIKSIWFNQQDQVSAFCNHLGKEIQKCQSCPQEQDQANQGCETTMSPLRNQPTPVLEAAKDIMNMLNAHSLFPGRNLISETRQAILEKVRRLRDTKPPPSDIPVQRNPDDNQTGNVHMYKDLGFVGKADTDIRRLVQKTQRGRPPIQTPPIRFLPFSSNSPAHTLIKMANPEDHLNPKDILHQPIHYGSDCNLSCQYRQIPSQSLPSILNASSHHPKPSRQERKSLSFCRVRTAGKMTSSPWLSYSPQVRWRLANDLPTDSPFTRKVPSSNIRHIVSPQATNQECISRASLEDISEAQNPSRLRIKESFPGGEKTEVFRGSRDQRSPMTISAAPIRMSANEQSTHKAYSASNFGSHHGAFLQTSITNPDGSPGVFPLDYFGGLGREEKRHLSLWQEGGVGPHCATHTAPKLRRLPATTGPNRWDPSSLIQEEPKDRGHGDIGNFSGIEWIYSKSRRHGCSQEKLYSQPRNTSAASPPQAVQQESFFLPFRHRKSSSKPLISRPSPDTWVYPRMRLY
ncbi:uncharacterized protein [Phyllobates terribilis]|uniref:uncharacterized protein n=1 Tax=Phyllobates terribilis TaxID=111132 RepID=UPI003CCB5408